jgi:hypothetical protein
MAVVRWWCWKRWQRGSIGRLLWVAVKDCSSGIGQGLRQKNMQQWLWHQHHQNPRATIMTSASALARTAREDASDARDIRWQQWTGDRSIAVAVPAVAAWIQQKHQQGEHEGMVVPDQHMQGKGNARIVL